MRIISSLFLLFLACSGSFAQFTTERSLSFGAAQNVLAHVTRADGGFKTTILVQVSENIIQAGFQLLPYDKDGNLLDAQGYEGVVLAGEILALDPAEMFPGLENISHLVLADRSSPGGLFESRGEVLVSARYQRSDGSGIPARVDQARSKGMRLRTLPGDWSLAFDGLAAVNTGLASTPVWLTHYTSDGQELERIRIAEDLAPMGKIQYVAGDWNGSPFTPVEGSYLELSADQHLAAMALRGTRDGLLWANHLDVVRSAKPQVSPIFLIQPSDNNGTAAFSFTYNYAESVVITYDREGGLSCGSDIQCGLSLPDLNIGDDGVTVNLTFTPPQAGVYHFTLAFKGPGGEEEIPLEIIGQ